MDLHLVGGFLGSGKTTAIASAASLLSKQGKRVGIITNDQGKYLVDTAFLALTDVPTVEVTGGCFCCNYHDLDSHLNHLITDIQPDLIFAESVGSCADLVATVIRPLLNMRHTPASLSVFTDIRLLERYLHGDELPYNENVVYIFEKQIEESGLLILNKADLLPADRAQAVAHLAVDRYPQKHIRLQNSLNTASIQDWLTTLNTSPAGQTIMLDYEQYGAGEAQLAWLNQEFRFTLPDDTAYELAAAMLQNIFDKLRGIPIGHVKFLISDRSSHIKLSFTGLESYNWSDQLAPLSGNMISILVNARAETGADQLRRIVDDAAQTAAQTFAAAWHQQHLEYFHPAFPRPSFRILDQ
jgi:Ni2+-binding GTPase involved in maturation of urease and hydrogenase